MSFLLNALLLLISIWCRGKLHSVDQYLNFKLTGYVPFQRHHPCLRLTSNADIRVENEEKYPHLLSVTSIFIRGSVVRYLVVAFAAVSICCVKSSSRYVHLSKDDVDIDILQANFTALMSMPAFLGFRALTSSNRIQLVRKLIAMPPMLLEPSNKALKIKTHKNVLVFLRMICIAFVLNRIYQRRS